MSAAQYNHPGARRPERGLDRQSAQQSGQRGQRSGGPATRPTSAAPPMSTPTASSPTPSSSQSGRFPIVQFPSLPLIAAFLAGAAGKFPNGSAHSYFASVSYLAITIWAYEELVHGVNWFRRLLGLAFVILVIVRVAHALHA